MLPDERRQGLFQKFRIETIRQLDLLRTYLRCLEELPADAATGEILKAMVLSSHTVKGNMGTIRMLDEQNGWSEEMAVRLELTIIGLNNHSLRLDLEVVNLIRQAIDRIELECVR